MMTAPAAPLLLFHWSPVSRRKAIIRRGMVPGSPALDGSWRPPHTCWSNDPELAWELSGKIHPEVLEWDLWMCNTDTFHIGFEIIFDHYPATGREYAKEYRVYERIYKRDIWHVGTRPGVQANKEK